MVAVVLVAAKQCQAGKRKAVVEKKKAAKKKVRDTLRQWDESGTGSLNFEELREWLSTIGHGEDKATDDEVKWVQSMANFHKAGVVKAQGGDDKQVLFGSVLPEDFATASAAWMSYRESKVEIDAMFEKFDKDQSAYLDKAELAALLKSLNEENDVEDSEVEWVLSTADTLGNGVITRPELTKALSLWYQRPSGDLLPTIQPNHATQTTTSIMKILPLQKQNQSGKRKEAIKKKQAAKLMVKETLEKWDKSGTGALSFTELQDWLSEISAGDKATDEEVRWVQLMAQKEKIAKGFFQNKDEVFESSVLPEDFAAACQYWVTYKESKEEVETYFAKYDTDSSGSLDRSQLLSLLTDLNEGVAPEDSEVDWVFLHADQLGNGVINKPELSKAIGLWYSRESEEDAATAESVPSAPKPAEVAFKEVKARTKDQATTLAELKTIKRSTQAAKRKEIVRVREAKQAFVKETLEKWDKSGTGSLSFDELKKWLSDNSPEGEATDEETMWIASIANLHRLGDRASAATASILPQDFITAYSAWISYKECKDDIEAKFAKYDTDSSGSLDKAQLAKLLTDLNDGVEPTSQEVDWVMSEADQIGSGTITKPELQKATSLWYSYTVDGDAKDAAPGAPAATPAAAPAATAPDATTTTAPTASAPAGTPAGQVPSVKPTPACGGCSVM